MNPEHLLHTDCKSTNEEVLYDFSKHSCTANLKEEERANIMSDRNPRIL